MAVDFSEAAIPSLPAKTLTELRVDYNHMLKGDLYAEYTMRNTGLDEAQAGIKTAGRNINNLRYTDMQTCHPYGRRQRRTNELLDESVREE